MTPGWWGWAAAIAAMQTAPPAAVPDTPDAAAILAHATEAAGGEAWSDARTLTLTGSAIFYGASGATPVTRVDDYRMWRVFDRDRTAAHGAEGKVRIVARSGEKLVFTVGYDGAATWNERGVIPAAEADAFWASNFGFGIIRRARDPGFRAERVADDNVMGHPVYMVRLTDPQGGVTLFGIDRSSHAIRYMGFATPRGWHERLYDDFIRSDSPRWLQARHVTLRYNGVKANEVRWNSFAVDAPIPDAVFMPGAPVPEN